MDSTNVHFKTATPGKDFELYLRAHTGLSEASIKLYVSTITGLLKGKRSLNNIEDANLALRKHPSLPVRSAIKYFLIFGGIPIKDLVTVKQKTPRPRDLPTMQDIMKCIDKLENHNKMVALFMLHTGCRCHEVFSIKVKDIEPSGRVVFRTKGEKYREFELPEDFNNRLQDYLRNSQGLGDAENAFYTESSASPRSKVRMFARDLGEKSKKLLGRYIGTHDIRRIVAVFIYNTYKDVQLVQRILGHSDVSTTMRYIKYATDKKDVRKVSESLGEAVEQSGTH